MPGFDALDPKFNLYQNLFIEASAGCGKTFAVENLILRLLSDPEGPKLDEILVVTFTRAATYELKERILKSLEKAYREENEPNRRKRFKNALYLFDEAKIFTIHGFCFYCLRENVLETDFFLDQKEESASSLVFKDILKDFLRLELSEELIHLKQLEKLLKAHQNQIDLLVEKLFSLVSMRLPISLGRPFSTLREAIFSEAEFLKKTFSLEKEKLYEDLLALSLSFESFCNRKKEVKEEIKKGHLATLSLFENETGNLVDLPLIKMTEENKLKRPSSKTLFYPTLLEEMQKRLIPLLKEVSNPSSILASLAEKARPFVEKVVDRRELVFFEDLLQKMEKGLQNESFVQKLRDSYRAVFIDEFQDTDPLQWKIFSTLFLNEKYRGSLYLVGDPKQSIYRFRGSDVYTYMRAKKEMGEKAEATLSRNFRSDPKLISAFNTLFEKESFFLPKTQEKIEIPFIEAGLKEALSWEDGKGSIHFCITSDEKKLFSFIYAEVLKLSERIPLNEIAILVKDRFQAARFQKEAPFPLISRKTESLIESKGFYILQDLIYAALFPKERGLVVKALAGPLFEVSEKDFDEKSALFHDLNFILETKGILAFFDAAMEKATVEEKVYHEMLQLVEMAQSAYGQKEGLILFFQNLKREDPETESLKIRSLEDENAAHLMTLHMSKGLEFSIVFPVALVLSEPKKGEFQRDGNQVVFSNDFHEEKISESLRRLYVGMTRAKKRLYLPFLEKEEESPIKLFLKERSIEELSSKNKEITYSYCQEAQEHSHFSQEEKSLIPPLPFSFNFTHEILYSYSSLASLEHKKPTEHSEKTLPSGIEVGNLFHTILEALPFEKKMSKEALKVFVEPFLKETLLEKWHEEVADLIFQTLHLPLSTSSETFSLLDIEPKKMVKEMEFLYETEKGICKGFIDLFFEKEEKVYFLDWKSNDLHGNYTRENLEQEMKIHQYDLQVSIYQEAAERTLQLFKKKKRVQGAFYLFLRGPAYLYFPFNEN